MMKILSWGKYLHCNTLDAPCDVALSLILDQIHLFLIHTLVLQNASPERWITL